MNKAAEQRERELLVSQYAGEIMYFLIFLPGMASNNVGFRTAYSLFLLVCTYLFR